jgi:hypothetical protein
MNKRTLDYAAPSELKPPTKFRYLIGIPGLFGMLAVYPGHVPRVGQAFGAAGLLAMVLGNIAFAVITTAMGLRANLKWHYRFRALFDGVWLALVLLPPGCGVILVPALEVFHVPYWE